MNRTGTKFMVLCLVLLMSLVTFSAIPGAVSAETTLFAAGSGTDTDPYQISNVNELQNIKFAKSAHFIQVNDIDASETANWNNGAGFEPIGEWHGWFSGSYNGNGYRISGLYINRPTTDTVGLFGAVYYGTITNAALEDVDISGQWMVGGLAGYAGKSTISGSYSTGNVEGYRIVGGLAGQNWWGTISQSFSSCSVVGDRALGGLVGENVRSSWIWDSYATGSVTGDGILGGLVGSNFAYYSYVINCFSTGLVTGSGGGLVGYIAYDGYVRSSFWDVQTSGKTWSDGGTGLTTANMKQKSSFPYWDFYNKWAIVQGVTYPYLQWEKPNIEPVAVLSGPFAGFEGSYIYLTAANSYDPDGNDLRYRWDYNGDGVWDTGYSTSSWSYIYWADDYSGTVSVEVSDRLSSDVDSTTIIIYNSIPSVVIAPIIPPIIVGGTFEYSGSFTDQGPLDTHSVSWNFGDGEIILDAPLTVSHAYTTTGSYSLIMTVTDDDGGVGTYTATVNVLTPIEATTVLISQVEAMNLADGTTTSLNSKLENALPAINKDNPSALGHLGAFINEVEAQSGKELTLEQTEYLIHTAQTIIDNL